MENNELILDGNNHQNEDNDIELQLAENIEIPDEEYNDNSSPNFAEKRELLKKTKILKQTWSIVETYQKIKQEKLILSPAYQRNAIWPIDKKTSFIESIFMDILIPPIYVVEIPGENMLEDSSYEVVDGKQRLTAIKEFIGNNYRLKKKALEYYSDLYGDKNYSEIEAEYKTEIKSLLSSVLDIYVITANSPEFTKYDIFSRLNKGSEKLRVNEIRKAIYRSDTLEKIEEFVKKYLSEAESDDNKLYRSVFTKTNIQRYDDYGRFYKSIAFYIQSKQSENENWEVLNYNSRPRDMINFVLNEIQRKSITIDDNNLNKILEHTLKLNIWLKSEGVISNQIEYIIDAIIPFIDKFEGQYDLIFPFLNDPELIKTFDRSPSTTSNVNLRLSLAAKYLNR